MPRRVSGRVQLIALLGLVALAASPASAHEIPQNVTVLAFVRPEGERLRVLVRVPLEAMRDVEFPLRGPGYLVLDGIDPLLREAAQLWIAGGLEFSEDGVLLAAPHIAVVRVSLPSDRSFTSFETALAHTTAAPLAGVDVPWQQASLDVLLEYPIASDEAAFSVRPTLAHLGIRTTTVLRFRPPRETERLLRYEGDPGLVQLEPRWYHATTQFLTLGFQHILDGLDHLLFVLCLVIPFRRVRPLVAIVTSFTVAHSITLAASVLGFAPTALWFPPLVETLIALSIVWMAFENIAGARLEYRWIFAFAFGLIHGFGFSFALRESLQFAGTHLATALLAFNIGVEAGQLLVVALAVPLLEGLFRRVVKERIGVILLSALVAHTAWHWMTARGAELVQYEFRLPALDGALLVGILRALLLLLVVGAIVKLLSGWFGRLVRVGGPA